MMPILASAIPAMITVDIMPWTSPQTDSISNVPGLDDNSSLASMGGDIFDLNQIKIHNNILFQYKLI